jgi:hypothetical protein
MREYRDELVTAHRRIEQLEGDIKQLQEDAEDVERILRDARPRSRWKAGMLGVGIAIGLTVGSATFAIFGRWLDETIDTKPLPPIQTVAPAPTAPPQEPLVASRRVPDLSDVDGDGVPDLITTFVGRNDGHLRVMAIDGATFKTLWTAGPFTGASAAPGSAGPHLVVIGDRVVVADATGTLHVLARANGVELTTYVIPLGGETCFAPNAGVQVGQSDAQGAFRVGNVKASATEVLATSRQKGESKIIDVVSGGVRAAPEQSWCFVTEIGTPGGGCARDDSDDCARYTDPPMRVPDFNAYMTWYEGKHRVFVGNGGSSVALGWTMGAATTSWRHGLAAEGEEIQGYTKNTIGQGSFVTAYENDRGKGRVIARSVESGEVAWQSTLADDDRDPYPVEMGMSRGRVMLVTRSGTLHVLDAATGTELHHM